VIVVVVVVRVRARADGTAVLVGTTGRRGTEGCRRKGESGQVEKGEANRHRRSGTASGGSWRRQQHRVG
jgi:hypothetical protein